MLTWQIYISNFKERVKQIRIRLKFKIKFRFTKKTKKKTKKKYFTLHTRLSTSYEASAWNKMPRNYQLL